jgi:amino acid transporter
LTLFAAQSLSVPFYILGFTEAIVSNFPILQPYFLWIAIIPGIILFAMTWIGADWAIKLQFVILAILGVSILIFLGGALFHPFSFETLSANSTPLESVKFFRIFAIFFPAVTGIMAGVNMSGDLKDPGKSIPVGTMLAIVVGGIVYGIQMILTGGAFPRQELIDAPYEVLVKNALFGAGFLVAAGVVCATLSSALGSFLGAPRVLQALAKDRIINSLSFFAKGTGKHNEPVRALILSGIITFAVLIWGGINGADKSGGFDPLNLIAEIVTMFFLYTYGMVNMAAFVESYGNNPSFRPKFRFYHWSVALFGAASCIIVSFLINPGASFVALLIIMVIFVLTARKEMKIKFGDARRGFLYSSVRNSLLRLARMGADPKNWRPTIAVLSGNPNTRSTLLEYARLFECERGIMSLVRIIVSENLENIGERRREEIGNLNAYLKKNNFAAFPEVLITDNFDSGLKAFLQISSIGPIKPNIAMFGWPKEQKRVKPFFSNLRTVLELEMSNIVLVDKQGRPCLKRPKGRIDLWWRGEANGSLMVILAYLLRSNDGWQGLKLRILRKINSPESEEDEIKELNELIKAGRVDAEAKVIVSDETFEKTLRKESSDAAILFLGFMPLADDKAEKAFEFLDTILEGMPPTFLVASSGEADLLA